MWRPKNWGEEKPQVKDGDWSSTSQVFMIGYNQGVEAGADAMLSAIEEELPDEIHMLTEPEDEEEDIGNDKDED